MPTSPDSPTSSCIFPSTGNWGHLIGHFHTLFYHLNTKENPFFPKPKSTSEMDPSCSIWLNQGQRSRSFHDLVLGLPPTSLLLSIQSLRKALFKSKFFIFTGVKSEPKIRKVPGPRTHSLLGTGQSQILDSPDQGSFHSPTLHLHFLTLTNTLLCAWHNSQPCRVTCLVPKMS